MTHHRHTYLILLTAMITSVMSSCIYESLPPCPGDKVRLTIANDWLYAPTASPEGMACLFYRHGVASPWRFDFPGRDGGRILLAPGEYSFVMYNDDTSRAIFATDGDGHPFVTTRQTTVSLGGEDLEVHESPDMMWGYSLDRVAVSTAGVEYTPEDGTSRHHRPYEIVTEPRQLTPVYTVRVLHTVNLHGVTAMKGVITGMASGIDLSGMNRSDVAATVAFDPAISADSTLTAGFHNFGLPAQRRVPNLLRLYFLLSDGRTICRQQDVTQDVTTAPDPLDVTIVIDSISLPYAPPATESGAFDPSVAGWKTVVVNYGT